jgi:glyoxylase-like metal-dependent hydrolase (beta-lactamase superfamily II)
LHVPAIQGAGHGHSAAGILTAVEVRTVTTGRVRPKARIQGPRRYLPGGWSGETLPVNAFAVSHPDGICLFDTGQIARAAAPGYLPRWHPFLRLARFELGPEDEAAAQVDPASVRWVVLSHLHTDHVGGLEPFARAEVLVSRVEWERAQGLAGQLRGYLPQQWPAGLEPRLVDFDGPAVGPFPGSHDVAGDRRLVLLPTPGHTPGHMALLVREGGCVALFAGDHVASPGQSAFLRREGAVVLAAHDPDAAGRAAPLG